MMKKMVLFNGIWLDELSKQKLCLISVEKSIVVKNSPEILPVPG